MALADMMTELRGSVPKLPITFTKTLVNRAYNLIRTSNLWSFNLFESSWITPPLVTIGTATTTQGSAAITFDANAIAALNASVLANIYSPVTVRQFRIGVGGIYSIIAYNSVTGAATLDRIYGDPGGAGQAFQVYQLYYTPPTIDFRVWLSVRNPQLFIDLDLTTTRAEVDAMDPQRTWYQFPSRVVPFAKDLRGQGTANASSTLGYQMFELWGQPIQLYTYQCYGIRNGVDLVAPTDTLPYPLPEELVIARAKDYAYEWAEANKDLTPRGTGPDYKYLRGQTMADYTMLLQKYRMLDKDSVDNWITSRMPRLAARGIGYYNTIAGYAGPYAQA